MNEKNLIDELNEILSDVRHLRISQSDGNKKIVEIIQKTREECEKEYNELKEAYLEQYATGCTEGAEQERSLIREDVKVLLNEYDFSFIQDKGESERDCLMRWFTAFDKFQNDVLKIIDKVKE